jgi:hypothetical protein
MTAHDSISLPGHDSQWYWIFKLGGSAAWLGVAIIPIQIIIYTISPPPTSINEWFVLFQNSPLLGLLNQDMLYLINNILLIPVYLALYIALKPIRESMIVTAFILGLVGIAAYIPSNTAFEMLKLSEQYTVGTTQAQQSIILAAGQALIVQNSGTAYLVYYILNAIALLLFAVVMLQSSVFSRNTAYAGIIAGILMLVPSNFGTIGLIFSFLSLLPWALFSILIARRLFQLGHDNRQAEIESLVEQPHFQPATIKTQRRR